MISIHSMEPFRSGELTFISQLLYIQHCDFDSPLSEQLNYDLSDPITATCYEDNLLVPVICVIAEAIGDSCIEPCAGFGYGTNSKEGFEMLEGGIVGGSEDIAARGVASEENEWEGESRVKDCARYESVEGVEGDAYGG